MALTYDDLCLAYEFVSSAEAGDYQGFVCRKPGKIYLRAGEFGHPLPDEDQLPEDLDENEQYVALPNKRQFDLGKPLVLDFARQFLADDFEEVRRIFSKRGAYGQGYSVYTVSIARTTERAERRVPALAFHSSAAPQWSARPGRHLSFRFYDCLRHLVPFDHSMVPPLTTSSMFQVGPALSVVARDPGLHLLAFVAFEFGGVAGLGNRECLPAHAWRGLRLTAVSSGNVRRSVGRRALRKGADAGEHQNGGNR